MRRTRFDTRLIQILSAMGALAIIVGIAGIAVNRYLQRTNDAVINDSLPAIEIASRIGASAEVAASLSSALLQADTSADLERIAEALKQAVTSIVNGTADLRSFDPNAAISEPPFDAVAIVDRMEALGLSILQLKSRISDESQQVLDQNRRVGTLIEAGLDLARLRITAGITDLYSRQSSPDATLDRLADQHFFTFERLSELAQVVEALQFRILQIPSIDDREGLRSVHSDVSDHIEILALRTRFLPSQAGRQEAQDLIAELRGVIGEVGLLGLQGDLLTLQSDIEAQNLRLIAVISALSDHARQTRDAVRDAGLLQISEAERMSTILALLLLGVLAISILICSYLWYYARQQIVLRLGGLSQRIVSIAQGEHGEPLTISGHDEIGRMEKALNILRRRSRDATELSRDLEAAVIDRTGEVVVQLQESDAARAEAEAANRSKTEFLARMSHEIRTPLNGLIGMLSLLESETEDNEQRRKVRTAGKSARDLLALSNDILAYSSSDDRLDRGNPVHFRLRDLVGQVGQQLQALASEKGLEVAIDCNDDAPPVLFGDVVKIRQIVANLVSNAAKYTKSGSVSLSVDYAIAEESGQPVLSFGVADTGIGMTKEEIENAFELYQRANWAQRSGTEGSGLGLAISRNLTEVIGGRISVESEPGLGSRFTLTVPLMLGDLESIEDEDVLPQAQLNRRILVVDDNKVNRLVARGYLERLGCQVEDAETAAAGLKAVKASTFDLILIDLDLPDMNGEELAAQLALETNPSFLVALTAHLIEDTEGNRQRLGVSRILSKPISPRALKDVLVGSSSAERGTSPNSSGENAVLKSLRDDVIDIGAETTGQIVSEFLSDLPDALKMIVDAAPEDRRRAAHRLKGASSNFQLKRFCELLAAVEVSDAELPEEAIQELWATAKESVSSLEEASRELELQIDLGSTK